MLDRLLAEVERPERWDEWPPHLEVSDKDFPNAFAGIRRDGEKRIPYFEITRGEIEQVAEFDPDALAFSMGHELGHLCHYHSLETVELIERLGAGAVPVVMMGLNREQELEADLFGMELALQAGFTYRGLSQNLKNTRRQSHPYCAIEGLQLTHPSWQERTAFLAEGEHQQRLWRSMAAFSNGVFFLQTEPLPGLRVPAPSRDCS